MSTRTRRPTAIPRFDALEARTLLSVAAGPAMPVGVAHRRYVDALVGAPSPGEPARHALRERLTVALDQGAAREAVALNLLRSTPADDQTVRVAYTRLLRRDPTRSELRAGRATLDAGADVRALVGRLAASGEYYRRIGGGTGAGFATALARDLLLRATTPEEVRRWGRDADRPAARRRAVREILDGREYRRGIAEGVLSQRAPVPTPRALRSALRLLARPDGLDRLQARVLASEAVYRRSIADRPTPVATRGTVDDHPPGLPLPPVLAFTSSNTPVVTPPDAGSLTVYAAGPDGSSYAGGPGGLLIYHPFAQLWSPVGSGAAVLSASAVSDAEVWVVEQAAGAAPTLVHYVSGAAAAFPAMPAGVVPAQVAAASDGTVWVLTSDGSLLAAADDGASGWSPVAGPGGPVWGLAVGSAGNIWVQAGPLGSVLLSRYTGSGWQVDASFPAPSVLGVTPALGATSDGSAWARAGAQVYVRPAIGAWYALDATSVPQEPSFLAPVSQNRAFLAAGGTFWLASIGLVDQQPNSNYPTWTPGQQAAYDTISLNLGVTDPQGLRARYTSTDVDLSDWANQINLMSIPPTIAPADWHAVLQQLFAEFTAVDEVRNVFANIAAINQQVRTNVNTLLPGIESLILAEDPGPSGSTYIRLALEGLVEAAAWGLAAAGLPVAGAVAASVLASSLGTAASMIEDSQGGSDDSNFQVQYSQFTCTLTTLNHQADLLNAQYEDAILGDYGRKMAISALVASGAWDDTAVDSVAAAYGAIPAYTTYAYQSLVPAQWQVVQFDYVDPFRIPTPKVLKLLGVPADAANVTLIGHKIGAPEYWFQFSNKVGAHTSIHAWPFVTYGPFPTGTLMDTLGALPGLSLQDFWTQVEGWQDLVVVDVKQ